MVKETEKDGCMAKTGKGCLGFFLGPALLIGSVYMLFWNEGEYLRVAQALDEAEPQVQQVENVESPAPELEGKLVFMRGQAATKDVLRDETYGVETNAIVLKRSVQYAQWVEKKTKRMGTKKKPMFMSEQEFNRNRDDEWIYTYQRYWKNEPVSSCAFYDVRYRDANCVFYKEQNQELRAQNVQLGGHALTASQISRIGGNRHAIPPTQIPPTLQGRAALDGNYLHIGREPEGGVYFAVNTKDPAIGDVRICWDATNPTQPVSLVAVQRGNSFEPYTASNGEKIDLLYTDLLNSAQCFEKARSTNIAHLWGVRFGGWLMLWGGFACMLSPLARMIPFCRKLAEAGATIISLVLGSLLSLLTVGVAKLFFQPLLAVFLLLLAGALIWPVIVLQRKAPPAQHSKKNKKHNIPPQA